MQGVGYRAWAADEARRLGIQGWVRNRFDGSVELLAIGPERAVAAMTDRCWAGPRGARVDAVTAEAAAGIAPERFEVKPTV